MKGGLAAMLKALELLKESKMRRQLVFVATAGEEIGYDGLKSMIQHGKLTGREASYCVIGEPTELKVARAHKGGTTFRIVFQGKSAHSSRPELGINAVENASLFVRELIDWRKKLATIRDPDLGSSILTVTIIRGGVKNNVVPESCELTIDCRRIPLHTPETITEGLLSIIQNLRQRDPSFHATVEMIFNNEPFLTAKDSPIVTLTEAITGSESIVVPYGTEAPAYQGLGISTVILGPGSVEQAHIANEFIELSEVRKAVSIYGELIRRVCL
jgi:acetylornithine deacetylase/succinyl-diaminopimelate desuccinylase-like protein